MHKQDNTNRDTGLDSIMESMYSNHEAIDDEDTGRIPHDVDSFKGPDDQDNTSYQVAPELDAAAGGDFIAHLNTIEFDDQGAADLVEWLARYNLGAS